LPANLYEAMFLVDAAKGGSEFANVVRHVTNLLGRVDAEIVRIEKWDERKLAYRIKRAKRGIYILVYFRAEGAAIRELRHDVRLSEEILRVLVLEAEQPDPVRGELYSPDGEPMPEPEQTPPQAEAAAEGGAEQDEAEEVAVGEGAEEEQ